MTEVICNAVEQDSDEISFEYSYDEKQFLRMSSRANAKALFVTCIFACYMLAVFGAICVLLFDEKNLQIFYGVCFAAVILLFCILTVCSWRKQIKKMFLLISKDGIARERAEIVGHTVRVTNFCRDSVSDYEKSYISFCKKYKDFFVIRFGNGSAICVPLSERSLRLYDAIKDDALFEKAAAARPAEPCVESPRPTDAMSFEYELTRKGCADMMRRIGMRSARMLFVLGGLFLFAAAVLFVVAFVDDAKTTRLCICGALLVTLAAMYVLRAVNILVANKRNGEDYFDNNSVDGRALYRIELSQQGIVAVNVLKTTRNNFRLSEISRVTKTKDFFAVEFTTRQILPVPFNAETARLYDVLAAAVPQTLGKL